MCGEVEQGGANEVAPERCFCGKYPVVIDDKSRLTILVALRKSLGERIYLRKNTQDRCIDILPEETWNLFLAKLNSLSRLDPHVRRLCTIQAANATLLTLDKAGRVVLSAELKSFAGISSSQVILTGAADRLKVWEPSVWAEVEKQAAEEDLEARVFEKYQL